MLTAFSGFAFEDSMENGGEAVKLGIFRAQSYKVAKKLVRESVRQADGSMRQTGPVKRKRDDLYLVDCAVMGVSEGTSKDPKCSLRNILEFGVFPEVKRLVGAGGRFEGYLPVWQDDSAGPHVEATFLTFLRDYFQREGWVMEPQAAQMPHMNTKDLAIFPAMSRRHCTLARRKGGLPVLKEDEIWLAAKEVYDKLPN